MALLFVIAFVAIGAFVYHVSYFDNSRYWGLPYHTTRDAAGVLAITEGQANMQQSLDKLPSSIDKHIRDIKALQEQQKYLYNKLFNATVDLEKNSNLDLGLIERIGPTANLYLKDLTQTPEAIQAIGTYEVNLPPDSPVRNVMSDLRLALGQEPKSKAEYLEKLSKWRSDENEKEMQRSVDEAKQAQLRQEREWKRQEQEFKRQEDEWKKRDRDIQRMIDQPGVVQPRPQPEPAPPQYEDPNYIEPIQPDPDQEHSVEDAKFRTATEINGEDSEKLGLAHSIMADIEITQVKMVALVKTVVREYELIDMYTAQLNLEKADPSTLKIGAKLPVSYMFVRKRSEQILEVGQPLYACRIGIFFCHQVGAVKGVNGEKAQAPSPTSGRMEEGFLIPIELSEPAAGRNRILHIYEPPNS